MNDAGAREAVLGLKKKPVFKVSKIFEESEAETADQVLDLSPDQLRIWRNARKRVVESFCCRPVLGGPGCVQRTGACGWAGLMASGAFLKVIDQCG